ncbi:hypothetical protein GH714_028656 [Hevea brasiliensis]|uniref:Pectate lyase superfamily protein domain-containing protein n=1 Tax=Hevea brasiliensis TaxID=3981 RepID=A0A6A6MIN9_HEVBR|nr:hypothetical protein GH714_028656 [Hevea brasiliensis]
MSGGIQDVRVEDVTAINTESGVRIKTAPGRGGYVKDIFVRRMTMKTMKYVFWITGAYKTHVDNGYDPNALAQINNINYRDIVAENVNITASLDGFDKAPFTGICISNATVTLSETAKKILVIFSILILVGSLSLPIAESRNVQILKRKTTIDYPAISCRKHTAVLTEFGGVGDGKTLNTKAFQSAIANLSQHASDGGAQLIVPPGKWLTGSFNLTSHFTLFLQEGAVLLASQNEADFPIIDILPSYGREQNFSDGRYASLIIGMNLTDVVITGNNGTIDGQGAPWWEKYKKGLFKATRPFLIEILHTSQLQISNITLTNSPSWHVHPIYCSNVVIEGVTILAPVEVPNTDGINPDSCTNVRIEDVYIVSGDDCIAIKSGWDQYGIKYGMPTNTRHKKANCISPDSATIALGSEMSGGIQDVRAEDITAINTQSAVRIKTAPGRGGYIKDIFVRRMTLKTMKDIVAENVNITGSLSGFEKDPFTGFCISNATITLSETAKKILDILSILILVGCVSLPIAESRNVQILKKKTTINYPAISCRKHSAALTEFGGVGDGKNTEHRGFSICYCQSKPIWFRWWSTAYCTTGEMVKEALTSLGISPFSYKRVLFFSLLRFSFNRSITLLWREQNFPDGRFASLILGMNLTYVVITGNNDMIDGQVAPWWDKIKKGLLKATRPFLIELMYTNQLQISNITLTNSPSWHLHPIYCSNVVIQGVTILAPVEVPNTDGINPDSSTNIWIEDVYIVSGDDCIAVKSGWDEYGIKVGIPTQHLVIRRLTCISPHSATIALGSEMSGGIQDVRAEDITAINTESAVRIKTAPGRGGYIKDIFVRRMTLKTMKYVFWISGAYNSHPDNGYDPNALAVINNINYIDVVADNVTITGSLDGYAKDPFTGICIYNATITLSETAKKLQWNCTGIQGVSNKVTPEPCDLLPQKATDCSFPDNKLPIENVHLELVPFKKNFQ